MKKGFVIIKRPPVTHIHIEAANPDEAFRIAGGVIRYTLLYVLSFIYSRETQSLIMCVKHDDCDDVTEAIENALKLLP
jgi:hypothetical protein